MTIATPVDDTLDTSFSSDNLSQVRDALLQASICLERAKTYAHSFDSKDTLGIDPIIEAMQKVHFSWGYFWAKESK